VNKLKILKKLRAAGNFGGIIGLASIDDPKAEAASSALITKEVVKQGLQKGAGFFAKKAFPVLSIASDASTIFEAGKEGVKAINETRKANKQAAASQAKFGSIDAHRKFLRNRENEKTKEREKRDKTYSF